MTEFKRGIVVDGRGSQVRVRWEDNDEAISGWLDVSQVASLGMKIYTRPAPGTMVACLVDQNRESGVVVGALYNDQDPAPADSAETLHMEMDDGSTLLYAGGVLTITHCGGAVIEVAGADVTITANVTITGTATIAGNLDVTGTTDLKTTKINGVTQVGD